MTSPLFQDLPQLTANAIKRYRHLETLELPPTPKSTLAHLTACRAALSHVEALLRLRLLVNSDTSSYEGSFAHGFDLHAMRREARTAIASTLQDTKSADPLEFYENDEICDDDKNF
jgi:hypothetical protein